MRTRRMTLRNGEHPGLLLQRGLPRVEVPRTQSEEARNKSDVARRGAERELVQAAIDSARALASSDFYDRAFHRWAGSLPELTVTNEFTTVGRLVVGLGEENVLETGLRLHHTYGLPVLPGSALKGLASHYCDQAHEPTDDRFRRPRKDTAGGIVHELLFGTTDDSGVITFHDAWFVPKNEKNHLRLDVMTPHHPAWVDGTAPPTDFDSPRPISFLSVEGTFRVAVSWRGPRHELDSGWTKWAFELLALALADWGIGGKTSSGYGRLVLDDMNRPRVNARVKVKIIEFQKKTKKWRAGYPAESLDQLRHTIDGDPLLPVNVGDTVEVIITESRDNHIKFRWPEK